MPKLLIVAERFWPEDFVINDLAAELVRRGWRVTVLSQQPSYPRGRTFPDRANKWWSRESWMGVEILRFKTILGYRESLVAKLANYLWFMTYGSLCALIMGVRFDSVLVYQTGPLTQAVPAIVASATHRKPLVIWTQDVWPDSVFAYGFPQKGLLPPPLNLFVRWVYSKAETVLISCQGFRKSLALRTSKPMVYAPNWPLAPYMPATGAVPEKFEPVFLFAGNIGKVQNLDNVIKGFALARAQNTQVGRLRIVGDGSHMQVLKELAKTLDLRVEFPGRKSPTEMNLEYQQADYLILSLANNPIFRLTVPSKFQMYLSVGKPILCAAAGEVADMVRAASLGLTPAPDSPDEIAAAFVAMSVSDNNQRSQWSANSHQLLQKDFDRQLVISRIENHLRAPG